jgi:hypothetical protein
MGHPQGRPAWQTIGWLVAVFAGWLTCAGPAPAQARTPPDSSLAAAHHRNETLLGVAAPLEDLVRFAEQRDTNGVDQSIADIQGQVGQVIPELKPDARRGFEARLDELGRARRRADLAAAGMAAVEAYRTVILSLDASALTIPVQVDELSYASLKAELLTDGKPYHWAELVKVAAQADRDWGRLRGTVQNDGLRRLMHVALTSLNQAAQTKNASMAHCAAHFTDAAVAVLQQQYLLLRQ